MFIKRLEGFPNELLSLLPPDRRVSPSRVDHMLAVIRRDRTATLYVNELGITAGITIGRSFKKGEHVFRNDIMDIATTEFDGIPVPDDAGIALIFSVGWRKGFYYDFAPSAPRKTSAGRPRSRSSSGSATVRCCSKSGLASLMLNGRSYSRPNGSLLPG